MTDLRVGQSVWVKSALNEGVVFEREVCEIEKNRNGEDFYYLSRGGILRKAYKRRELIDNKKEAVKICQQTLEKKAEEARKKLFDFLKKYENNSFPETVIAWGID